MRSCLVTGGLGFIGAHLVDRLLRDGVQVTILDPGELPPQRFSSEALKVVHGSAADPILLKACIQNAEVVFHFAGSMLPSESSVHPAEDISENLLVSVTLLNMAVECGVRKIVFASSGGTVYGVPRELPISELHPTDPISSYGITKLATEKYLALFERIHGLNFAALRYSNPYGEGQNPFRSFGAVAAFLGAAGSGRAIEVWGDGSAIRDFIYIDDAVEATVRAADYSGAERIFNVGTSSGTSIQDLLEVIRQVTGLNPAIKYLPGRIGDPPAVVLDNSRARNELDWIPAVALATGVARTWDWCNRRFFGLEKPSSLRAMEVPV